MAKTGYTRKPDGQNRVPPSTLVPGRHFIGQRPPRPDSGRISNGSVASPRAFVVCRLSPGGS